HPVFDTQIAAMVCGFGDSASYETLVRRLAGANLDKASRFTDWTHRPLTDRQLEYALADVVHLRTVYERLQQLLAKNGRAGWFEEEMTDLVDPALYRTEPAEAWRRFRLRGRADRRFLGVLRTLAAWREEAAQQRDLPRGRIMRDEALLEIAAHAPKTIEQLVASADDLESIAADDNAPVRALSGWRRDIFGNDALALKHGRLALTAGRNRIELVPLPERCASK